MTNAEQPIRVLAVDDDPMVLDLVRVMFKGAPDIVLVATASDGDEVIDADVATRLAMAAETLPR